MRCLSVILVVLICSCANAQTKKETEDWIISKINKYKETKYTGFGVPHLGFSTKIISVKFTDCNFIIVALNEGVRSNGSLGTEKFTATTTQTIPINKLSEIMYVNKNRMLHLNTINDVISWNTNDPQNPSKNETTYVSFILIPVNLDTEDDLPNRIKKAFNHLRDSYCKKEEVKEVF